MSSDVKSAPVTAACPWCGARGQTAWGTCLACGRYYLAREWTGTPRKRSPWWWIVGFLALLVIFLAWVNRAFLPNPLTLWCKGPNTDLTSNSGPNQWGMGGLNLQQNRYIVDAPRALEGQLLWSVELGTPTRSVPVIVNGVLYIGGHFEVIALDARTGRRLWHTSTTGPVHHAPALAGQRLYIGLQDRRVLALDRSTGETVWEFTMHGGVSGSAVVADGTVYVGSVEGFLYALDAASGELLWQFKTQDQTLSPPALQSGRLYLSSTEGILYALNARTGRMRLRFRTPERIQDSPVVANNLVYFPSGGRLYAVAAGAREVPGLYQLTLVWAQFWLWQFPVPRPPAQTGSRWRFSPQQRPGGIVSAPAVSPEVLYVGDTNGHFYARDALNGNELWQFKAGGAIMAAPLIVGPRVYFGALDGFLYALDRVTGRLDWKFDVGAPIQSSPVVADGRLYVHSSDGHLHAVE